MANFKFAIALIPFLCVIYIVKSTNFKGSFDTTGGMFLFANPVSFHHYQLNSVPTVSQEVKDEEECIFVCANSTLCQSVNFKAVAEANEKHICQLLEVDKFVFPELFSGSADFHHYSLTVSTY